eukprot:4811_1
MGNKQNKNKNVDKKEQSKALTPTESAPKSIMVVDKEINFDNIKLIISYWFRIFNYIALDDMSNIISTYFAFESWYIIRHCSTYSNEDLLLGIFNSHNNAKKGKQEYIQITSKNDPYSDQVYMKVDLQNDVEIKKHDDDCFDFYLINGMKLYAIGRLACGLGHIGRSIIEWCNEQKFNNTYKQYILENTQKFGFVFDTLYVNKVKFHNDNVRLDIGFDTELGKCLLHSERKR